MPQSTQCRVILGICGRGCFVTIATYYRIAGPGPDTDRDTDSRLRHPPLTPHPSPLTPDPAMDPREPLRRFPPSAEMFSFRQPVSAAAAVDPSAKYRPHPRPDVQSRQIHRNRISYSCHACRRRKVKCDRVQPICGNCAKSAESCVYDEHVTRDQGDGVGVGVGVGAKKAGDGGGGGAKRRRTAEDTAESSPSRGGARSNGSVSSPPQTAPEGGKQAELETRMNRLAEIVNRWYKDASVHGVRDSGVRGVGGGAGGGGPPVAGENGFTQSQQYLDLLQQSTGPLRTTQSSSSSSPPRTSPTSTTPASSTGGGHSGDMSMDQINALSRNGRLTVGMLDAGIEAARQSGKDEEVGDLGLGHLSIQGGGRSRYVGTSFWGLLSSEVRAHFSPPPLSPSSPARAHGDYRLLN